MVITHFVDHYRGDEQECRQANAETSNINPRIGLVGFYIPPRYLEMISDHNLFGF